MRPPASVRRDSLEFELPVTPSPMASTSGAPPSDPRSSKREFDFGSPSKRPPPGPSSGPRSSDREFDFSAPSASSMPSMRERGRDGLPSGPRSDRDFDGVSSSPSSAPSKDRGRDGVPSGPRSDRELDLDGVPTLKERARGADGPSSLRRERASLDATSTPLSGDLDEANAFEIVDPRPSRAKIASRASLPSYSGAPRPSLPSNPGVSGPPSFHSIRPQPLSLPPKEASHGRGEMAELRARLAAPVFVIVLALVVALSDVVCVRVTGTPLSIGPLRPFWIAAPLSVFGVAFTIWRLIGDRDDV